MGDVKTFRVSSLSFGEVAQVFHDDRVVELSEQLEEEEQEGIRTEEDNKRSTKNGHGDGME